MSSARPRCCRRFPARAGNTWTGGGGSTNWSDGNNWGGAQPGYGTLTFTTGGGQGTTSVVDANYSMNQLLWTGASSWILNNSGGFGISLFDNGGVQAKIENQSTGLVTINAPIAFAAATGAAWGEINAVNGDLTFGGGTLTVNGSAVAGIKMFGGGRTTTFNNTLSATGKWFATKAATGDTIAVGGAFTSGDFYLMNGSTLKLNSGGSIAMSALRLGGDFGTTLTQNLALGATFQLTNLAGGQSFGSTINTVTGNTSNALRVDSQNTSGTNTLSGGVFLDSPLNFQQAAGGTLAVTGVVSNGSGLTKTGNGTVTLSNANTYTGGTTISAGVLQAGNNAALGTGGVTLNGGTLGLNGQTLANNLVSAASTVSGVVFTGNSAGTLSGALTGTGTVNFSTTATAQITPTMPVLTNFTGTIGIDTSAPGNICFRIINTGAAGAKWVVNHEGHGGYRIDQINANLDGNDATVGNNGGYWFPGGNGTGRSTLSPDVILLHIGTNDILQNFNLGTIQARLDALVTKIVTERPGAKLFVADLVPITTGTDATVISYNQMVDAVLAAHPGVGLLDMHTAFPFGGMGGDNVHPNDIGYNFMASQWYNALLANFGGPITSFAIPGISPVLVALSATLDVNATTATVGPLSGAGSVTLGTGGALTVNSIAATTFSGVISGDGSFTKSNSATLTLTGANTFTGTTAVSGGTLEAAGAGTLGATSAVTVNTGGTLLLSGAGNRVNDSAAFTMNGGTILSSVNALDEQFGTLTLAENSIIDFGTFAGGNTFRFADSAALSALWTSGKTLSIWNWTPSVDHLYVGTNTSGLDASQLGKISFYNGSPGTLSSGFAGGAFNGTRFGGLNGEVTPVPEPSSVATVMGLLGLIGWRERRNARLVRAVGRCADC